MPGPSGDGVADHMSPLASHLDIVIEAPPQIPLRAHAGSENVTVAGIARQIQSVAATFPQEVRLNTPAPRVLNWIVKPEMRLAASNGSSRRRAG